MNTEHFTGRYQGVFYIGGTPSKRVVEACERLGLVKFPSLEWRNFALSNGKRPYSAADLMPDDESEVRQ